MKEGVQKFLVIVVVCGILVSGWGYLNAAQVEELQSPGINNGVLDLRNVSLDEGIVKIPSEWEFYPNKLYTPKHFFNKDTISSKLRDDIEEPWTVPYGTYRLRIKLAKDQIYSMCGYSMDYSTRVFVNGALAAEAGNVSRDPDKSVPRINYYTIPVIAKSDGIAEVVVQYSNFVHKEGGNISSFSLSTPTIIEKYKTVDSLSTYLICGGLILLGAFYLIKFCVRRRSETFFFALCCFIFAVRNQRFYIVELIPWEYDWFIHYRLVVIFIMVQPWVMYMLFSSLYPGKTKAIVNWSYAGLTMVLAVIIFARSTMETAQISNYSYYISAPYYVYLVYSICKYFLMEKRFEKKDILTFTGIGILLLAMFIEAKWQRIIPEITRNGVTPLGMLVFVFLIMIVMELRYGEYQVQLIETRRKKQLLEKQAQMRRDFLTNISHEMLTPLTIMSGYAQRTIIQLRNNKVSEDTYDGLLHISLEAQRLSMLVEQILHNPIDNSSCGKIERLQLNKIANRILALCNPILEKNNNTLEICINPYCEDIAGNAEMLLQVVLNLCINANRHTDRDTIALHIEGEGDVVYFTLEDQGQGMDEDTLEQVFQRGYSGDGKTGLGLPICRDIITYLGGKINIYSQKGKGTKVVFWLHVWKESSGVMSSEK